MLSTNLREPFTRPVRIAGLVLLLVVPGAGADWLVTLDGELIETRGSWTIAGERLTYVDVDGVEQSLDLAHVDLEGSADTTALRGGQSEAMADGGSGEAVAPATETEGIREDKREEAKIILYVEAMCRPCTQARELLEELEVDFVIRDTTKSKRIRREYRQKAGHGGGLPIIDVDGRIIYFFDPGVVRRRIREFKEKEAAARSLDAG